MTEEDEFENALRMLNYDQDQVRILKDVLEDTFGVKLELIGGTWRKVVSPQKREAPGSRSVNISGNCSQSVIITGDGRK